MKTLITFLALVLFINIKSQTIYTYAGNGAQGYSGDGGQAISAKLNTPSDVVIDAVGNLYITEFFNHCIRKIDINGIITTIAGNGTAGYSGDGGQATSALLSHPNCIAVDATGNLYFSQAGSNLAPADCIRKIDTNGIITTVAGNGTEGYSGDGGQATMAQLFNPCGVKVDAIGNLFIADGGNNVIRKVDVNGIITTIAGTGAFGGYNGDNIPATSAQLNEPFGINIDAAGNLFIADCYNNRIRKVNTNGIITTIAGNGNSTYNGDGGQATATSLNGPIYVTLDAAGNLYIADYFNNRVRKINSNGIITTVAGISAGGHSGDGGQAILAKLYRPCGIVLNNTGRIFIADENNHRIRTLCTSNALTINTPTTSLCFGESITLMASGANTYTWSTSQVGSSINITPSVPTIYGVIGTDGNGCTANSVILIAVSPCSSIDESEIKNSNLKVYPNPVNEILNITYSVNSNEVENLIVYDLLGNAVIHSSSNSPTLDVRELKRGVYFIQLGNSVKKIVKE